MSRALFRRQRRTTPWLALGGMSGFALLALGFAHPPVSTLDAELGQALFAWRDGALAQACVALARLFDGLGYAPVQAAWVALIAALLASLGGDRPAAGVLVMAMLGQWGVNQLGKTLIDRPRPQLDPQLYTVGASFPSGHAMSATVLYGFLLLWLWPRCRPGLRPWLALAAIGWIAAQALARPLLGAHYLSDVLAGVALGLACLAPAHAWLAQRDSHAFA